MFYLPYCNDYLWEFIAEAVGGGQQYVDVACDFNSEYL